MAKNKAAWNKASAKSKCHRKALLTGDPVDQTCRTKAEEKFNGAIGKAEAKGGCVNTGDGGDIEIAVDTCVSSILALTPTEAASGCNPPSSCTAGPQCISLVDNSAQTAFGLRMSQLTLSKPTALTVGLVGATIASATLPDEPTCNLNGGATLNWLLEFNTTAHTLKTGGAKPVANPSLGYDFVDETAFGFHIQPATLALSLSSGAFSTTNLVDILIPVYLDAGATSGFALPLHTMALSGQLSGDQNCVGSYNALGLVPPGCSPDASHPSFLNAGTVHAYIALEDADAEIISALNESLCVLLSGNPGLYGDGGSPNKCKRDSGTGAIVLTGDYCSSTGMPGGCADSMEFAGTFAASSVTINN